MTRRPLLRTSLLALGVSAVLLACSADTTGTLGEPTRRYGGTGDPSTGSGTATTGSGSSTTTPTTGSGNGDTSSGSSGSSSGGASTSSGSSSGGPSTSSSGSSSGSTDADSGSSVAATPDFTVAVDNASPSINLKDTSSVTFTITPGKWTGPVELTVTGLPTDVTAAFDNPTVTLDTAPVAAKLTFTSLDSTAPNATPLELVATSGTYSQHTAATLKVVSELTISIPVNVGTLKPGLGSYTVTAPQDIANNPVTINFLNLDSTPHEIHAGNVNGFTHGKGTFNQNETDTPVRHVTGTGTYAFYLHDEGAALNPGVLVIK